MSEVKNTEEKKEELQRIIKSMVITNFDQKPSVAEVAANKAVEVIVAELEG